MMRFHGNVTQEYLAQAPIALALERIVEAELYRDKPFEGPILDIGCGDGLFAGIVMADPVDVGIDPNSMEIDAARKVGAYRELIACFGSSIPKDDNTFATAFSNSVLEHIPDLEPVLVEVLRVLKPGGNFYFTVPSEKFYAYSVLGTIISAIGGQDLSGKYRERYNKFWKHYHDYSPESWLTIAEKCGFQSVEVYTYNPARNCRLNDILVPLGGVGRVHKALANEWVFSPRLRRKCLGRLLPCVDRALKGAGKADDGGLVFCWVRKPLAGD